MTGLPYDTRIDLLRQSASIDKAFVVQMNPNNVAYVSLVVTTERCSGRRIGAELQPSITWDSLVNDGGKTGCTPLGVIGTAKRRTAPKHRIACSA